MATRDVFKAWCFVENTLRSLSVTSSQHLQHAEPHSTSLSWLGWGEPTQVLSSKTALAPWSVTGNLVTVRVGGLRGKWWNELWLCIWSMLNQSECICNHLYVSIQVQQSTASQYKLVFSNHIMSHWSVREGYSHNPKKSLVSEDLGSLIIPIPMDPLLAFQTGSCNPYSSRTLCLYPPAVARILQNLVIMICYLKQL